MTTARRGAEGQPGEIDGDAAMTSADALALQAPLLLLLTALTVLVCGD